MGAAASAERPGTVVLVKRSNRPPQRQASGHVARVAPRLIGPASIVASCASLQTAAALATTAFAAFGPAGTGALRFAAAAVVLLAVAQPRVAGRSTRAWLAIVASGAVMAVMNLCIYEAVARIPLGTTVTLEFLGPLALALVGARRRLDVAWAAAAAGGVVLLAGASTSASAEGIVFALGAAASAAAAIVVGKRISSETTGLDGLALSVTVAAVLTLPIGLHAAIAAPRLGALGTVLLVGVLGIVVPYALEFTALRRLAVKTFSILLSLDPVIAGLAGLLLLGQRLSIGEIAGIALVVTASAGAVSTHADY